MKQSPVFSEIWFRNRPLSSVFAFIYFFPFFTFCLRVRVRKVVYNIVSKQLLLTSFAWPSSLLQVPARGAHLARLPERRVRWLLGRTRLPLRKRRRRLGRPLWRTRFSRKRRRRRLERLRGRRKARAERRRLGREPRGTRPARRRRRGLRRWRTPRRWWRRARDLLQLQRARAHLEGLPEAAFERGRQTGRTL